MHAAADRPEFAPPPQPGLMRSFALAVLAHLLLLLALTFGFHWRREAQDAAVEAELWSALPQEAAPKAPPVPEPAPPPPPPQPVVKAPPEPPQPTEAEIALERERQKALEEKKRQEELERQKAEAQKKRQQELARQQEQARQLAEAKRKAEEQERKAQQQAALEERRRQQIREDTMKRMQAMAGGTGGPSSAGTAARSSGPSGSWAGKVQARVRPNIVFTDDLSGNPEAQVEVRLGPGGLILGTPRLVKSSGSKSWDDAVLRALAKTESLPPDVDGRYPSPVIISFRPGS